MYYLKCKSLKNQKYLEINAITCRRRHLSIAKLKQLTRLKITNTRA